MVRKYFVQQLGLLLMVSVIIILTNVIGYKMPVKDSIIGVLLLSACLLYTSGVRLTRSGEELLIEFKGILSRLDYLDEKYNGSKKRPLGLSVSAQHHICLLYTSRCV